VRQPQQLRPHSVRGGGVEWEKEEEEEEEQRMVREL
jgi:hypothetical protein